MDLNLQVMGLMYLLLAISIAFSIASIFFHVTSCVSKDRREKLSSMNISNVFTKCAIFALSVTFLFFLAGIKIL